jgi:hypothetical protein
LRIENLPKILGHRGKGLPGFVIRTTIGDEELAQRIDRLDKKVPQENLGQLLADVVQKRISELQLIDT